MNRGLPRSKSGNTDTMCTSCPLAAGKKSGQLKIAGDIIGGGGGENAMVRLVLWENCDRSSTVTFSTFPHVMKWVETIKSRL